MLKFIFILSLTITTGFAAEVATIDTNKATNEIFLVMTDETLQNNLEKQFIAKSCRLRIGVNSTVPIKENYFAKVCKAHVIQYLLNNNYRPDTNFRTFTK